MWQCTYRSKVLLELVQTLILGAVVLQGVGRAQRSQERCLRYCMGRYRYQSERDTVEVLRIPEGRSVKFYPSAYIKIASRLGWSWNIHNGIPGKKIPRKSKYDKFHKLCKNLAKTRLKFVPYSRNCCLFSFLFSTHLLLLHGQAEEGVLCSYGYFDWSTIF